MMASTLSFNMSRPARPLSANLGRKRLCLRAEAATIASAYTYAYLQSIRHLRNRIAHHEPVFTRNLTDDY